MVKAKKSLVVTGLSATIAVICAVAAGQVQSKSQQRCVLGINSRGVRLVQAQGRENSRCLQLAGNGKLTGTVVDCLTADPRGRVARRKQMVIRVETKKCVASPDFGFTGAAAVNEAAQQSQLELFGALFGADPDAAFLSCAVAGRPCRCQRTVTRLSRRLLTLKLRMFTACKRKAFLAGASSAADLEACVADAATLGSIAADSRGRIARRLERLLRTIARRCDAPGLTATAFPGDCDGLTGTAFRNCLDRRVECLACATANDMDGLAVDCDLFDDNLANASCSSSLSPVTPTETPSATSTQTPTTTVTQTPSATSTQTPTTTATQTPSATSTQTPTTTVAGGGIDAYFANLGADKVWFNNGSGTFSDSGQSLGIANGRGVALGDLDGDLDLDAYVANSGANKVWLNNGSGVFTDSGQSLGTANSEDVALGDVDGDLDLDAYVANSGANKVWLNNGSGVFTDSGQSLGTANSRGIALGDLDGDLDLDAYVANSGANKVWLNNGSGVFTNSGQSLGTANSEDVALGDVDGDSDLDAWVANSGGNKVWRNNGSATFTDSGQSLGSSATDDVKLADIDGDTDLDAVAANSSNQPNKVWLNNGSGVFTDSGQNLGGSNTHGVALGDVDGDTDLDAVFANGASGPNKVFLNNGSGTFTDSGQNLGNSSSLDVELADLDGS